MTQDEIIELAKQAGFPTDYNDKRLLHSVEVEAFAKLVAEKARQEMREEIVYTWVPPHFVDMAVESCAERAWLALVKHKQPWNVRQDVTDAILAKEQA
jgi:hypothetical protein